MDDYLCQVCDSRYTFITVEKDGQSLHICAHCLKEELHSGKIKLKGKERINFLEKIALSIGELNAETQPTPKKDEELFVLQFGTDLTEKVLNKQVDPLIGREKEIEYTFRALNRRTKNNPILVGEPGVGKTAIVERIAHRIATGNVPPHLKNKRIISLTIGNLVANTRYRGDFENRLKKIIQEACEHKEIILFIDEFHSIIGSGSDGSLDGAQMLKPAIDRGDMQIISATTFDEYRTYIEKDKALERRLQKITINEPTVTETIEIIKGSKQTYEEFHQVIISDEIIKDIVTLSDKYLNDKKMPDKAFDLLDEVCAHKSLFIQKGAKTQHSINPTYKKVNADSIIESNDFEQAKMFLLQQKNTPSDSLNNNDVNITKNDVATILHQWTGIPVQQLTRKEMDELKNLEIELESRIKGQNEVIKAMARTIKRSKLGLSDDNRPRGVFMFLGPSGVGKTELTKVLTELLLGDKRKLLHFNMSEFKEKSSISRLIGSPPGYIGYEDEGTLTKAIRLNPYSVVLFDEIDKAHPEVPDLFLQLYDEGTITDAKGRVINAKNCIFIMTSNLGSDLYGSKKNTLGYNTDKQSKEKDLEQQLRDRLKDTYRPEFINRIDNILFFNQLSKPAMLDITGIYSKQLIKQLETACNISLKMNKSVLEYLAEKGYDPELGARPLKREFDNLKSLIADKIVDDSSINKITVSVKNGVLILKSS